MFSMTLEPRLANYVLVIAPLVQVLLDAHTVRMVMLMAPHNNYSTLMVYASIIAQLIQYLSMLCLDVINALKIVQLATIQSIIALNV